ncbi:alpha/beta hydrolase fold domain-containing protein [Streptomyces parvulus]|nr:alpha/beta hydrolase fold domain-containing protein [Streptomyces parvulus]
MALAGSLVLTSVAVPASVAAAAPAQSRSHAAGSQDAALAFAPSRYTTITVTVDGRPLQVRWYKEICYVANPVAAAAQQPRRSGRGHHHHLQHRLRLPEHERVRPESAFGDQRAPIYFAVNNSGWMASYIRASVTAGAAYNSATSNVGAALKAGYVFVDVASRSRGLIGADGSFPGKAPAAVTDAKAAVRYLRLNDTAMPGSAERIVVNGTSGGGALASALGASGNSAEYTPYLAAVGAAGIDAKGRSTLRDDVFAVNAYCRSPTSATPTSPTSGSTTPSAPAKPPARTSHPRQPRRQRPGSRPTRRASACATPTAPAHRRHHARHHPAGGRPLRRDLPEGGSRPHNPALGGTFQFTAAAPPSRTSTTGSTSTPPPAPCAPST